MTNMEKQILEKLDYIKVKLDKMDKKIVDIDVILTEDDITALDEAEKDLKAGKTRRL